MLPEVEEFLEVKGKADQELNNWHATSRNDQPQRPRSPGWGADHFTQEKYERDYEEYRARYQEWDRKFHDEYRAANEKHRVKLRNARAKLRRETKDPMIIWMMDNIEDYWSYIETVLPILPATREELESLATEHEWCSEFDGFMDQATSAGIIAPINEAWDASELIEWVADEYDVLERSVRREIQTRVNKIVEKALAAAHNEKATANVRAA